MPYFHATFAQHIPSILAHGLGGARPSHQNFDCAPGTYLATTAEVALSIGLEAALMNASDDDKPASVLDGIKLIIIDEARIASERLLPDPQRPDEARLKLYNGIVDVNGMPVVSVEDALAWLGY